MKTKKRPSSKRALPFALIAFAIFAICHYLVNLLIGTNAMYDIDPSELDFETAMLVATGAARLSQHPWLVILDDDGSFFSCPIDDDPDIGRVVHVARPE